MFLHSYKQVCCAAAYCLTINNMQFCSSCVREQQKTKASQNCKKWWSFSTYLPQYNVHMPKCRLQKSSVKKLATVVKSRTPSAKNYEEKSSQFHLSLPTWESGVEDSLNVHMEDLILFSLYMGGSFFVYNPEALHKPSNAAASTCCLLALPQREAQKHKLTSQQRLILCTLSCVAWEIECNRRWVEQFFPRHHALYPS
jgi:hypothetical protein